MVKTDTAVSFAGVFCANAAGAMIKAAQSDIA
jgi:hypothetical protein